MQCTATLISTHSGQGARHTSEHRARRTGRAGVTSTHALAHTICTVAVGLLLTAAVAVIVLTLSVHPDAPAPESWASISVGPNDSLWVVAAAHPVAGRSTAETVELICERNNLASATIHPGQTILVPQNSYSQTAVALR